MSFNVLIQFTSVFSYAFWITSVIRMPFGLRLLFVCLLDYVCYSYAFWITSVIRMPFGLRLLFVCLLDYVCYSYAFGLRLFYRWVRSESWNKAPVQVLTINDLHKCSFFPISFRYSSNIYYLKSDKDRRCLI
jgi:hypothetical protein